MSLIFKWLESLSIDLTITDRCSRLVSPKSTCTTCLEHCDIDALTLVNNKISVDVNKCNSCGECITSCPVSAVKGNVPNRTIKNGLLYYEPHYCPTVKELLVFHKLGIKGIAYDGDFLDDPQWIRNVNEANQWLEKLKLTPLFFQNAKDIAAPVMSRRDLFMSVRKKGKQVAKELAPVEWRQNPNSWSIPYHYPAFQFFEVQLDFDKCSLCQSCFKLCQQGVFLFRENSDSGTLVIEHQKCTNCQLCVDVCNEDAVVVTEKICEKTETHVEVTERTCMRCRKSYWAFSTSEVQDICPVCSRIPADWLRS